MKVTSPYFLQSASNRPSILEGIEMVFDVADPIIGDFYHSQNFTVVSTKNGQKVTQVYSGVQTVSVLSDVGMPIYLLGSFDSTYFNPWMQQDCLNHCVSLKIGNTMLVKLDCGSCSALTSIELKANPLLNDLHCNSCYALKSIKLVGNRWLNSIDCGSCTSLFDFDLSNNTATKILKCSSCYMLTNLDLSTNTALTTLNCSYSSGLSVLNISNNTGLTSLALNSTGALDTIYFRAVKQQPSEAVAAAITAADSTTGTVYLNSADPYYQTVADAATAKGWTISPI